MSPGFRALVRPVDGSAVLRFYEDAQRPDTKVAEYKLTGGAPWHLSGSRPFAWDYLPPAGEREYGIIRLIAHRPVKIEPVQEPYWLPVPGRLTVFTQVHRVQDIAQIPPPHLSASSWNTLGQPFEWQHGVDPFVEAETKVSYAPQARLNHAVIQPFPDGMVFEHNLYKWRFRLSVPLNEPAAFAYDMRGPQSPEGFVLWVVTTPNVVLRGEREKRDPVEVASVPFVVSVYRYPDPHLRVVHAVVPSIADVPAQGTEFAGRYFAYYEWDQFVERLSKLGRRRVMLIEAAIGFVPYLGPLYDIAQFAYAAASGKTFWGEKVDEEQLASLGVVALMSIAFSSGSAKSALKTLGTKSRLIGAVLGDSTEAAIRNVADPILVRALAEASTAEQRELVRLVEEAVKSSVSTGAVLRQFDKMVSKRFASLIKQGDVPRLIERHADELLDDPTFREAIRGLGAAETEFHAAYAAYRQGALTVEKLSAQFSGEMVRALDRYASEKKLLEIFTDDFLHFRHDPLRSRYTAYLGKEGRGLTALQWARSQTTGRYASVLEARLGKEFRALIRDTLGDAFLYHVSDGARNAYVAILRMTEAQTYSELRALASKAGIGKLFEVDHVLEKRFLKSLQIEGFPMHEDDFFSVLLPKNPAVGRQVIDEAAGLYVHSEKTRLLREIIPHGAEDLYSLQQWWDAHVWVLRQLGASPEIYTKKMARTFEAITANSAANFTAHFNPHFNQTAEMFDPANWRPRNPLSRPGVQAPLTLPTAVPAGP